MLAITNLGIDVILYTYKHTVERNKMIKFASTRVKGWNTRWEHPMKTQEALWNRQARGYTLDWDEQKFLGDVRSLRSLYNSNMTNRVMEAAE